MDLFSASGLDLGESGRGGGGRRAGRPSARSRRVPLLNEKVVEEARQRAAFNPTEPQLAAARNYARMARSPGFSGRKETAVRPIFFDEVFKTVLGYRTLGADDAFTLAFEAPIRGGFADIALGHFSSGQNEIHAPFEVKGPSNADLDAIMPGRGRSPVQQAWDYAIDAPGSRWVLVSNCVELRLYGFGRGRDAYEIFDLRKLDESEEHARLWLILSAEKLLGGATEKLLRETDDKYRKITDELYAQYSDLRKRLIGYLMHEADGPKLLMASAIEVGQKLLDRILFMAFAQDKRTALLPEKLLERVAAARNAFAPEPVWRNFLNVFRLIHEKGNPAEDIWPYNGGLFKPDPVADEIVLPDALAEDIAALGQWDYGSDVPVSVLGHIFEQSITDIERERAESLGLAPPKVGKRKRQGVVYTPDIVTRFLVERTIGVTLKERSATLLERHAKGTAGPKNGDPIAWRQGEASERAYYAEYLEALRALTIVDPACGSGAFLVAAFDFLAREYRRVVERLAALGEKLDFDPFDEIVTRNLYGVDVNAESVEITRLALWLRTARRHHRLENLEATIKVGDSLIEDAGFTDRPFVWRKAFPEIFKSGGFDIVIGNPPYVRMELIKRIKPYLEEHYVVAADRADLYAYFFERGVKLLKPGGRLGYISSSTFFRTASGENLRTFLGDGVAIEAVVDFGDLQLFEGVTTYPAIVTLRKATNGEASGSLAFLKLDELPADLEIAFEERARPMPRSRLTSGSWQFEDEPLAALREKIASGRKTLGEVYGPPLYGIKTGLNDAFIVDTATRDRLVAADPKSSELLTPFLRGENIQRWRVESEGLFLVTIPRGTIKIDEYPAVRDWLLPFKPELEKRATKQEWFELQQAQLAYHPRFAQNKTIYPIISQGPKFTSDKKGRFINDKAFMLPESGALLAFLNSKCAWFLLFGLASALRGGRWRLELREQYVSQLPIPHKLDANRRLSGFAEKCSEAAERRAEIQLAVYRRFQDLAATKVVRSSRKLENWWKLDFNSFRAEVKRVFRAEIPVKERADWESYLAENAAEVRALTAVIEGAEQEIDTIVYRLFDLTPDEVKLLEDSLDGQY